MILNQLMAKSQEADREMEVIMKCFTYGYKLDGTHFDKIEDLEYLQMKKNG